MPNQNIKQFQVIFQDLGNGGGNTQTVSVPTNPVATNQNTQAPIIQTQTSAVPSTAVQFNLFPLGFTGGGGQALGVNCDTLIVNKSRNYWVTLVIPYANGVAPFTASVPLYVPLAPGGAFFMTGGMGSQIQILSGSSYNSALQGPPPGSVVSFDTICVQ